MDLFSPYDLGPYRLHSRLAMVPMTRLRCGRDGVPGNMIVEYYAQRVSMGLTVTEDAFPNLAARTWLGQPDIETTGQTAGWRKMADAIHARSGIVVMQIMHARQLSHPTINETDQVVSASDTIAPGYTHNLPRRVDYVPVEPLIGSGIERIIRSWARVARNAVDAGMGGVQTHGASGYLVHQFLALNTNMHDSEWGGDPYRRVHLAVKVTRAIATEIGGQRTSIRLSPEHNTQDIEETDPADVEATCQYLAREIAPLRLGFIDILHTAPDSELVQGIRRTVDAPLVVNWGFRAMTDREEAVGLVADGVTEAVGVGRPALTNPGLVERQRTDTPENMPIQETIYGGGASEYTGYPTLQG